MNRLSESLATFSSDYEKFIILGDFNVEINENHTKSFCENYDLTNLIKQPTCYKNPTNPTYIDLILTNAPRISHSAYVVETGLSDFHLMTMTVMRKSFKKYQPSIISYRSYKNFSNAAFRETLIKTLSNENLVNNDNGLERFCDISLETFNKHAPCKKKHAQGNQMSFFNKDLSKAIMSRTKLRNISLQNRSEENKIRYTKRRNFCVSLLRKTKKRYHENLNEKSVVDNKLFWKNVKPFLSDKVSGKDEIHLLENNEPVKTDLETAEVLNNFFFNVVQNRDILRISNEEHFINCIEDRTLKALKYRKNKGSFSFVGVDKKEIEKEVLKLDANKSSQNPDIPIKPLKENVDIFSEFVSTSFSSSINVSKFPENLKLADITPAYKMILKGTTDQYEKHIFKQMSHFFENILSKYQCGFRKGFSTQHWLLAMLEKWKRSVDNGKAFGALLTDLSKAFDCLDHELLIAKLNACGFSLTVSKLIHDYLSNRKRRTKVNSSYSTYSTWYSTWYEIIFGLPQGLILRPLLFNIFLINLFFFCRKY